MRIQPDTHDSASLVRDAVSDTGRSLSGEGVDITLGIGMTMASFHCLGTMPSRSEELTISVTGSLSSKVKTFSSLSGTSSGPGALLISVLDSARQTRHLFTVGGGEAAGRNTGRSPVSMGGNEVQIEPKCPLIKLARSAAASASWPGRDTLLDLLFMTPICLTIVYHYLCLLGLTWLSFVMCDGSFGCQNRPVRRVPVSPPQ